jgi:Fes/CIP4, and EFC/F-BAR homology domain
MSQHLHFESSFWGQKFTSLSVPDYQAGLRVLHEKLSQSRIENDEIITFLRERVSVEESYAVKLVDQGQQRNKAKGFLRDEGATLRKGFDSLRAASELLGSQHMELALNIHEVVLKPLIKVSDEYKADVASAKRNIDMKFKQFDNGVKDVERLKSYYVRKCRDADRAEELALNSASEVAKTTVLSPKQEEIENEKEETTGGQQVDNLEKAVKQEEQASGEVNATATTIHNPTYTLAGQVYSANEFEALISKMRQEIPITEHKVAIFGTYQNTSTGENIARWLQQNIPKCKDSPATADLIGQQLITSYHILKLIGQLGEKFVPSSHHVYQWKATVSAPDTSSNGIATSALEGVSGILGKFGSSITSNAVPVQSIPVVAGEEPHKVARREAELADEAYLKAIRRLDNIRLQLEEILVSGNSIGHHVVI